MNKSKYAEIIYDGIDENNNYEEIINRVISECFENEGLEKLKLYVSITLTNPENIRVINKKYRNIDKETDVLSFPMFEKEEIEEMKKYPDKVTEVYDEVLGDIIISIARVEEQAVEYGHSFERELAYMSVHGFFHLMGYDHMKEEDKTIMRAKEDEILNKLKITREG